MFPASHIITLLTVKCIMLGIYYALHGMQGLGTPSTPCSSPTVLLLFSVPRGTLHKDAVHPHVSRSSLHLSTPPLAWHHAHLLSQQGVRRMDNLMTNFSFSPLLLFSLHTPHCVFSSCGPSASLSENRIERERSSKRSGVLFLAWLACVGMYVMTMRNSIH